jgi:hypothetical protein
MERQILLDDQRLVGWTEPEVWIDALEDLGALGWAGLTDAHETLLNEGKFCRRTLVQKLDPGTRFRCAATGRYGVLIRQSVLEVLGNVTEGVASLVLLAETPGAEGIHGRELRMVRGETIVLAEDK